jgi:hypothetical protein
MQFAWLNNFTVNDSDANVAMGSQPGSQQLLPSARLLHQVERGDPAMIKTVIKKMILMVQARFSPGEG